MIDTNAIKEQLDNLASDADRAYGILLLIADDEHMNPYIRNLVSGALVHIRHIPDRVRVIRDEL